jgi:hypothetical protein
MLQLSPAGQAAITNISQRHGFSTDAVMSMLDAVLRGNGSMAQFNHSEFCGSGQWMRGGMTMVSDMFNNSLKGRVDNLCSELSNLIASQPGLMQSGSFQSQSQGAPSPSVAWGSGGSSDAGANLFAPPPPDWWGPSLRFPNSTGSQNNARYAYFAQARRLAVDVGGTVTIYDTLDHQIGGFSQQQSADGSMSCSSQYGTVPVSSLPVISINGVAPARASIGGSTGSTNSQPGTSSNSGVPAELLATLQKLADLQAAGVLTSQEFNAKKAELLSRL